MKSKFFVLMLALIGALPARSQEIQLNEDPAIAQLMRNWVNGNRADPRISGWQIQILASTDRQQVEEGRNRFRSYFPGVTADWIHEKPYYKLRVGAFRTRLEALAFISTIADAFPGAYPAKETNLHPRKFLE